MNRKKSVCIMLIVCMFFGVLTVKNMNENRQMRYTATFFDVFDTKTDIIGYEKSEKVFTEQVAQIKEKLLYYHRLYDIYHDYDGINNIKTINDNAGMKPVKVDRDIIELLKYSKEMYEQTGGQMNVAMGSVLSIWHDYREAGLDKPEEAKLPTREELEDAAEHINIENIVIDEEASTVYLADEKMSLDVGSIGKGYAVQRTAEYAAEHGMKNMLLSVGGNVCAVGEKTDGSAWNVGIQNPDLDSEDAYVKMVAVKNASVVTSGNYQRYYMVDGVRYCHIIDEDTLMPADYFASVSVVAADSGRADALSTALYNMPFDEGYAMVDSMDGVEAMWIFSDGRIEYSEKFHEYVKE